MRRVLARVGLQCVVLAPQQLLYSALFLSRGLSLQARPFYDALRQTLHFEAFVTQMSEGRALFDASSSSSPSGATTPTATLRIAFWLDGTGCAGHMLRLTCAEDAPSSEHAAWKAMRAEQGTAAEEALESSWPSETAHMAGSAVGCQSTQGVSNDGSAGLSGPWEALRAALVDAAADFHAEAQSAGEDDTGSDDEMGGEDSKEAVGKASAVPLTAAAATHYLSGDTPGVLRRALAKERALANAVGWADGSGSEGGTRSPSASGKYDRVSRTWLSPAPHFPAPASPPSSGPPSNEVESRRQSLSGRDAEEASAAGACGGGPGRSFMIEVAANVSAELGWQAAQWRSALHPSGAELEGDAGRTSCATAPSGTAEAPSSSPPNPPSPPGHAGAASGGECGEGECEKGGERGREGHSEGGGEGHDSPTSTLPSDEARAALLVIRASYLQVPLCVDAVHE